MGQREPHRMYRECQCEHESHFDNRVRTPNGKAGHVYGAKFPPMSMREVQQTLNPLRICEHCSESCWKVALSG